MAQQTQQTDIVAEFVKNFIPKDLLETAELLVSLGDRIPDRKTMVLLLEKRKAEDPKGEKGFAALARPLPKLIESVVDPFRPEDFAIESPDNALEKFFARTRQDLPPIQHQVPGLPDLPTFPEQPLYSNPFFGPGPCGVAAAQLWREHLDSREARWVGPNPFYYESLQELAETCRRGWILPFPTDMLNDRRCADEGNAAYARCVMAGGNASQCRMEGERARNFCRRLTRPSVNIGSPFGR